MATRSAAASYTTPTGRSEKAPLYAKTGPLAHGVKDDEHTVPRAPDGTQLIAGLGWPAVATVAPHQPVRAGPRRPPGGEVPTLPAPAQEPPRPRRTAPNPEPPTLLREALERRRRAGFPWNDQAFEWLVQEVTGPMMDNNWHGGVFWRQLLLDQLEMWRQAYGGTGPGRHSLTIFVS